MMTREQVEAMTEEERNVAIAKLCGWSKSTNPSRCVFPWNTPQGGIADNEPNYCQDLNAMHEAEALQTQSFGIATSTQEWALSTMWLRSTTLLSVPQPPSEQPHSS